MIFADVAARQPIIAFLERQGVVPNDAGNIDLPMQTFIAAMIDDLVIPPQHDCLAHWPASVKLYNYPVRNCVLFADAGDLARSLEPAVA